MKQQIITIIFLIICSCIVGIFWFLGLDFFSSIYFLSGLVVGFLFLRYMDRSQCFKLMVEFLPYPVIVIKTNGKTGYINPRFTENFGYLLGDVADNKLFLQKVFLNQDKFKEAYEDKGKRKFYVLDFICKDGGSRKVIFRQILINGKRLIFLEDMSDCSEDSERLRISEEKFAKAFRASPDAITISNLKDGRYIEVNKKFTEVVGYSQEETIGKTSLDLKIWAKPEEREQMVELFKKQGYVYDFEFTFGTKLGKTGIALMSAEPLVINGETCLLIVSRDVTEKKKMEETLRNSEKNLKIEVEKRTKELQEKMIELEKLNDFMIGRELKINELKKEIENLKKNK